MTWFVDTALCAAGVGAVAGAFVPQLIGRLPEPEPDPEPELDPLQPAANEAEFSRPLDEPKELYADLARLPGLAWRSALACAVAAGLIGGRIGWHPALLFLVYLVPVCVALAVVDWRTRYLPSRLIMPSYAVVAVLIGLAALLTSDRTALVHAVVGWLGALLFFGVMWVVVPSGMAYGDVRLAGLLGMALGFVGIQPLVLGLYTGFVLGGVVGLVLSGLRIFHHRHSPFGPHMVLGALLGVVAPGELATAYGGVVTLVASGIRAVVDAF